MHAPTEVYVKVFAVNTQNEVLMLQRKKSNTPAAGLMDLPGGLVESGEQPVEALIREVREETKLALRKPNFLCKKDFIHPISQNHIAVVWFTGELEDEKVILDHENINYKWVAPKNLIQQLKGLMLEVHSFAVEVYLKQLPK